MVVAAINVPAIHAECCQFARQDGEVLSGGHAGIIAQTASVGTEYCFMHRPYWHSVSERQHRTMHVGGRDRDPGRHACHRRLCPDFLVVRYGHSTGHGKRRSGYSGLREPYPCQHDKLYRSGCEQPYPDDHDAGRDEGDRQNSVRPPAKASLKALE